MRKLQRKKEDSREVEESECTVPFFGLLFVQQSRLGDRNDTMKLTRDIFLAGAAAVLGAFCFWANGMELDGNMKSCRGVNIDVTEEHMMHMNDCLKAAGAKKVMEVAPDKMPCFGKCVFVKKGLIDAKGHPHKEKIMTMVKDGLPKAVHDDLDKRMTACLLPNATEMIDPEDPSCTTYIPVMMCIHIAFMEECEDPERK